jgi:hypothetical protein
MGMEITPSSFTKSSPIQESVMLPSADCLLFETVAGPE